MQHIGLLYSSVCWRLKHRVIVINDKILYGHLSYSYIRACLLCKNLTEQQRHLTWSNSEQVFCNAALPPYWLPGAKYCLRKLGPHPAPCIDSLRVYVQYIIHAHTHDHTHLLSELSSGSLIDTVSLCQKLLQAFLDRIIAQIDEGKHD